MKPFPQVLKGAATATSKNPARIGYGGPRYKKPTMPEMPWDKPNDMARKCAYCGSQKPGMQPLRLNGKRGYWHLKCFEKARKEEKEE